MSSSADRESVQAESGAEARSTATVELPQEFQAEIREFARALPTMDYYRVLGVERGADAAGIREGFFERSKRYHPDRYFRKEIGAYRDLLNEIYKRVVAAHDVLRDSKLRGGYDETLPPEHKPAVAAQSAPEVAAARPSAPPRASARAPEQTRAPSAGPVAKKPSTLRKRHGMRSPDVLLRGLKNQLERSRSKAQRHFDEARQARGRKDWPRCVASLKLAMAFDPRDRRLHDELAEVLPCANAERAAELRKRAELLLRRGEKPEAVGYLEEACDLLPTDAELAHQLAALLLEQRSDLAKAAVYGERAVSLDSESVAFLKTLGHIYRAQGNSVKARKFFQSAWALDPLDREVKAELGRL